MDAAGSRARLVAGRNAHRDPPALEPRSPATRRRSGSRAAALAYQGEPPTAEELEARLDRDLERGITGLGPHLHDIAILAGDRDLRRFGSQGEQRVAVLALLLGEAELLAERSVPPILLLDDVLSELDEARRRMLAERIRGVGQSLVTATSADALPAAADQLIEVLPGVAQGGLMERIGTDVRSEMARFGPRGRDGRRSSRPGLAVVGDAIAVNSWPVRLSPGRHAPRHGRRPPWAFELGAARAEDLGQARACPGRGQTAALRFAPGPLLEPRTENVTKEEQVRPGHLAEERAGSG